MSILMLNLSFQAGLSYAQEGELLQSRGVVVANAEVTYSSELQARVEKMPLKPGDSFSKGDLLIEYNCDRFKAELRGAEAGVSKQKALYQTSLKLQKRQAAGALEVTQAKADLESAQSQVDSLMATLSSCEVIAPFTGRIIERGADEFETPTANAPVLIVSDTSRMEVQLISPSQWLGWLEIGAAYTFTVEETGKEYAMEIVRIGAKVDAVSQTVKLFGRFIEQPDSVLPGMSGVGHFKK